VNRSDLAMPHCKHAEGPAAEPSADQC